MIRKFTSWVLGSVDQQVLNDELPIPEIELPVVSLWLQDGTIFSVEERDGFTLIIPDWHKRSMLRTRERASLITVGAGGLTHESVWVGPSWKDVFHFSVISDGTN